MSPRPPLTPAGHITQAKESLAAGHTSSYPIAHALVAIAELLAAQPKPGIPHVDLSKLPLPVVLTDEQQHQAATYLQEQTAIASLDLCRNFVVGMVRRINGADR